MVELVNTQYTPSRITFKEDGDANHYSMLTEDGKWWLAILANGEQTSARQVANFRRLAACWNACTDEDLEYLEGLPKLGTTLRKEMEKALTSKEVYQRELCDMERQRDDLLEALCDIVNGSRLDKQGNRNDDGLSDHGGGHSFNERVNAARAAIAKATGDTA